MKTYRNKKGQFKSKRDVEVADNMRLYTTLTFIVIACVFGFALKSSTYVVHNVEAYEPQIDVCGLSTVECPNEVSEVVEVPDEVTTAVKAIAEALGKKDVTEETKKRVQYLYDKATEAGVSFDKLAHIVWCESMYYSDQSQLTYNFTNTKLGIYEGEREMSFGIFQLSVPHHDITKEQALDAYFSIDYAIQLVQQGGYGYWYGYKSDTDSCGNQLQEYWK